MLIYDLLVQLSVALKLMIRKSVSVPKRLHTFKINARGAITFVSVIQIFPHFLPLEFHMTSLSLLPRILSQNACVLY